MVGAACRILTPDGSLRLRNGRSATRKHKPQAGWPDKGPIGIMQQTTSPPPRGELEQLRQELLRRILNNEARRKGQPEARGK